MHVENSNSQNVNFTITSCQRGTSQGSYRIFLEDGSSFFLSVDFFLKHKLSKGLVVEPELLLEIKSESLFVEAYMKANSLLSRQLYSRSNLKVKLIAKDFDRLAIERALDYLEKQGRIDDLYFSKCWVLSRLKSKLDSYNGLFAGLLKKGINGTIAKSVLIELYTEDVEYKIIIKSIEKLGRQGKTSDAIMKTLLRKGFKRNRVLSLISEMECTSESN